VLFRPISWDEVNVSYPCVYRNGNLLSEIAFLEYCKISAICLKYSDAVIVFERLGEGKKNMTIMM